MTTMNPVHRSSAGRAATLGLGFAACFGTCLGILCLGGCESTPPEPAPVPVVRVPSTFSRAFDAALGAISDQGLSITTQDRSSGSIVGTRGALAVTATVRPQPDGTTRVEFSARGAEGADAGISQRVLAAYNARMGR